MGSLRIDSNDGGHLTIESERTTPLWWQATLVVPDLSASTSVEAGPNRFGPSIGDFFQSLAEDWRGWTEQKSWETNDRALRLAATHDGLGTISLEVELGRTRRPQGWRATATLKLDAGALERVRSASRSGAPAPGRHALVDRLGAAFREAHRRARSRRSVDPRPRARRPRSARDRGGAPSAEGSRARRDGGTTQPTRKPARHTGTGHRRRYPAASGCHLLGPVVAPDRRRQACAAATDPEPWSARRRAPRPRQEAPGDSSPEITCATRRACPRASSSIGRRSSSASIGFTSQTWM